MTVSLKQVELRKVDIKTRMPFRYGIATMTAVPHVVVFADFEVDGQMARGVAADILPPKWFTKVPETLLDDEIAEMLAVIRAASKSALQISEQANVFRWWQQLYELQMADASLATKPPLLKGFGVTLLERSAIDAACRLHKMPFHQAVKSDLLGIQLGEFHAQLDGLQPADLLPENPQQKIGIRHTVGLSDPLLDSEIAADERLADGLPQSLESCIEQNGLTYFKIKVPAKIDEAKERLLGIAALLRRRCKKFHFTLDGNEFYTDAAEFHNFWKEIRRDENLSRFLDEGLLVVEQPLHRDVALSGATREVFQTWNDQPPIIIDESDGELSSLRQALDTGYVGTSHKNCKGIFKGLANTCLLKHLNNQAGFEKHVYTGEDLMNIGPIALQQDLAVAATLGLTHLERNGHHYVTGLNPLPVPVQSEALRSHGDLYYEHKSNGDGYPSLLIQEGQINLESVNRAPFGYDFELNAEDFELIEKFT